MLGRVKPKGVFPKGDSVYCSACWRRVDSVRVVKQSNFVGLRLLTGSHIWPVAVHWVQRPAAIYWPCTNGAPTSEMRKECQTASQSSDCLPSGPMRGETVRDAFIAQ